ncbi:pyroglutamyl-peptidase I [Cytobacillus sp. IB215316]|uniref:pyroglutamyl-peptidase I n=1 Tax=Cytobacillus sp. IB215316 TaxID=3097354 RepID=UPI002A17E793|nr:pyroglutamyl-peptidase I [Cytobacillus sp. IB215316]MDX8362890.1 pyroglutamyl-peptidase I [Cytobacillus sp. IB215316]
MKKLLLTGFVPFLDNPINPTEDIVKKLDKTTIGNYEVFGRVLPVEFAKSGKEIIKLYEDIEPDAVISLGLAAGNNRITPERIAINCNDGAVDNTGAAMKDQLINIEGPDGVFSTLPIRRFVDALQEEGLPAEISNSAGTYLCNNVMYTMLTYLHQHNKPVPSGFVHIPASHELALKNRKLPSWSSEDLIKAVTTMIGVLDEA